MGKPVPDEGTNFLVSEGPHGSATWPGGHHVTVSYTGSNVAAPRSSI